MNYGPSMSRTATPNHTNGRHKHRVLWKHRGVPSPAWKKVEKRVRAGFQEEVTPDLALKR